MIGILLLIAVAVIVFVIVFLESTTSVLPKETQQSLGLLSKDGLTQEEADDVVADATHMSWGFSNFSLSQARDKIERIDRKLVEVDKMDDPVMRSAWRKWLNHYRRTAVNDEAWYSSQMKTAENRRKAGL